MNDFGVRIPKLGPIMSAEDIEETVTKAFEENYDNRESALGVEFSHKLGRASMLEALETAWADYLSDSYDKTLILVHNGDSNQLHKVQFLKNELFRKISEKQVSFKNRLT